MSARTEPEGGDDSLTRWKAGLLDPVCRFLALAFAWGALSVAAYCVEPIKIAKEDTALDLTRAVEMYSNQGEKLTVSTAPGPDGIVRRIEVESDKGKTSGR